MHMQSSSKTELKATHSRGQPKMSIKKKPITTTSNTTNNISRKKLFKFLFKSYIKSAYSGISHIPATTSSIKNQHHHHHHNGVELRREYYNDMNECSNIIKLNKQKQQQPQQRQQPNQSVNTSNSSSGSSIILPMKFGHIPKIPATARPGRSVDPDDSRKMENNEIRQNMTVTQQMDRKFDSKDDIGWGNKVDVSLVREPTSSFGVCIVGGKVNIQDTQISGIFIKNIIPLSPAEESRQIKIGDRILSVNGHDVSKATQDDTIKLIKNAGCTINLVLQSFDNVIEVDKNAAKTIKDDPSKSNIQQTDSDSTILGAAALPIKNIPASITVETEEKKKVVIADCTQVRKYSSSEDDDDDDDDEDEEDGRITTKSGKEIDRKSAGNVKRTKEECEMDQEIENEFGYTTMKLQKKYGNLGEIVRAYVQRDSNNCMGLALAGHRDRNEMGSFIAGINPKGNAKSQNVEVGDEILEINGRVLHKLCHLNASVIIKGIPGVNLEFILLRNKSAAEDILAVKPVGNFPAVFDQFDHLYSCFKNVRSVTIQKIGTSLGIMIIEGKHSDVGQGIFISDIQENSNAETAGVRIGEMILAVNKDLLIDCNYDAAASLLKRAEGIVTLTLCNPNKKEDAEKIAATDDKLRAPTPVPLDSKSADRAKTPEPAAEPVTVQDPATAEIIVNKDTTIEINAEMKPLGVVVIKGDSSTVQAGVSIIVIHENGSVAKDKRLKTFDKVLEIDGTKLNSETSEDSIRKIFMALYPKVKMIIYRGDPPDLKEMEIDLSRKSGKDLGLGFAACKENGIYITEIVTGSIIDLDRRAQKGDIITHINGEDIRNCDFATAAALLKQPKLILKIVRPKGKK